MSVSSFIPGSIQEREVYEKAGRRVSHMDGEPGQLELSIKHAQAIHGTDFDVIVEVQNVGGHDALAKLTVMSNAVTYNSLHRGECERRTTSVTVPAQKGGWPSHDAWSQSLINVSYQCY